jgi:hypothetical protein
MHGLRYAEKRLWQLSPANYCRGCGVSAAAETSQFFCREITKKLIHLIAIASDHSGVEIFMLSIGER